MTRQSVDPLPSPARIVIVSFLSIFIIFGIRLSFSVFFAEFVLVEGWSNEASAAIFSLNMLVFAATAPLAGIALDSIMSLQRPEAATMRKRRSPPRLL